jgi:hypothetical protein
VFDSYVVEDVLEMNHYLIEHRASVGLLNSSDILITRINLSAFIIGSFL